MNSLRTIALALGAILLAPSAAAPTSVCFGTPSQGALRGGCKLPVRGANFTSYSNLGAAMGRTYAHCEVVAVVRQAFADVAKAHPNLTFVLGESGFASGGEFKPHKSHQNGLSVDFFVPVRDRRNRSVPLPRSIRNRWGYDLEFDSEGRSGPLTIDFRAIAIHLAALQRAARARHVGIARVFFDTTLQRRLHSTPEWSHLSRSLRFSTRQGWWRHDEHYHVDFAIPCKPMSARLPKP